MEIRQAALGNNSAIPRKLRKAGKLALDAAALQQLAKHNVARFVGGGKFTADALLGVGTSPIMVVVSVLYLLARVILMAFGSSTAGVATPQKKHLFKEFIEKTIPEFIRHNPVETAAFLGTAAAMGFILHGLYHHQPLMVFTGIAAATGETIIWLLPYLYRDLALKQDFSSALKAETPRFWQRAWKAVAALRYQPVRLGSYLIALSSVSVLFNGLVTLNTAQVSAGVLYIVANIVQGLWVDKNVTGEQPAADTEEVMPD